MSPTGSSREWAILTKPFAVDGLAKRIEELINSLGCGTAS